MARETATRAAGWEPLKRCVCVCNADLVGHCVPDPVGGRHHELPRGVQVERLDLRHWGDHLWGGGKKGGRKKKKNAVVQ